MTREIKFRAWVPENDAFTNKGMYGSFTLRDIERGHDEANIWCEGQSVLEPNWDTLVLMQYTGLKDKNGKEIYEGDIVERQGMRQEVVYKGRSFEPACLDECEVIGNIWENPELLQQEEGNI